MNIECTPDEFLKLVAEQAEPRRRGRPRPIHSDSLPLMKWTQDVYKQVARDIGSRRPEVGGILLGPEGEQLATHFVFDETGRGSSASWTFGHVRINEILR